MKPNREQIASEIAALTALMPRVPKFNVFDENNHIKIEAQIDFLKGEIDTTAPEFEEMSDEVRSAVIYAQDWMSGEQPDSPSEDWKPAAR